MSGLIPVAVSVVLLTLKQRLELDAVASKGHKQVR